MSFGFGCLFESFLLPIGSWLVGIVLEALPIIVLQPPGHSSWSKDRHRTTLGQSKSFPESPQNRHFLFIGVTCSKDKSIPNCCWWWPCLLQSGWACLRITEVKDGERKQILNFIIWTTGSSCSWSWCFFWTFSLESKFYNVETFQFGGRVKWVWIGLPLLVARESWIVFLLSASPNPFCCSKTNVVPNLDKRNSLCWCLQFLLSQNRIKPRDHFASN